MTYEYKKVVILSGDSDQNWHLIEEAGADGWELIAVDSPWNTTHFYFKKVINSHP